MKAITGNLIVKQINEEAVTNSGIVLSRASAEAHRSVKGEVISTGEKKVLGDKLVPMEAKVGDIVLFDVYKASEYQIEGVTYYRVKEEDLFGIL